MTKGKGISRRRLLRGAGLGAGVCLGLPILEAMLNDRGSLVRTAKGQGALPVNLLTFFIPNGMYPRAWWPETTGSNYPLSRCLMPLAGFKEHFTVVQGLRKREALRNQDINNDAHQRGHASFATGGSLAGATTVEFGSFDQLVADNLGQKSRFASLPVALGGVTGEVSDHISWKTGTTPVPADRNPAKLFEKLFGVVQGGINYRQSILDFVQKDANDLASEITLTDKQRLDEYLTSVRELERALAPALSGGTECIKQDPVDARFVGEPPPRDDQQGAYNNATAQLLMRLQVLAFSCGMTQVGSFMLANRANKRQFPWLGAVDANDGHHGISHLEDAAGIELHTKIVVDEMEQFAFMLGLMKSVPQGEHDLLHNSLIFFANECGLGVSHDFNNTPVIIAGHAGGQLKLGQHLLLQNRTPYDDMIVTVLNLVGVPTEKFGVYGTKTIPELL